MRLISLLKTAGVAAALAHMTMSTANAATAGATVDAIKNAANWCAA